MSKTDKAAEVAEAINALAMAIYPAGPGAEDASGTHVASLVEAIGGVTAGLMAIAEAIRETRDHAATPGAAFNPADITAARATASQEKTAKSKFAIFCDSSGRSLSAQFGSDAIVPLPPRSSSAKYLRILIDTREALRKGSPYKYRAFTHYRYADSPRGDGSSFVHRMPEPVQGDE